MVIARGILAVVVLLATYLFVFWVPFSLLDTVPYSVANGVSLACGVGAAAFVWWGTGAAIRSKGLMSSVVSGALIVGGIGFAGGFFGPVFLTPNANQGPLLGIFITGPLGFVLGAIGGAIYWTLKKS